jgi:hypothetical protein
MDARSSAGGEDVAGTGERSKRCAARTTGFTGNSPIEKRGTGKGEAPLEKMPSILTSGREP